MHQTRVGSEASRSINLRLLLLVLVFCGFSISTVTILVVYHHSHLASTAIRTTSPQAAYRPLAQQSFYLEHFTTPLSERAKSTKERTESTNAAIERLRSLLSNALAVQPAQLGDVRPQKGLTFTSSFVNNDYHAAKSLVNQWCEPSLVRVPSAAPNISSMCLSVFENSYIGPSGAIYEPNTNTIHDMAGGCCVADWVRYTRDAIPLASSPKRKPIVLSMGFHHAVTYHHVIHELLPRLLPLLPLLDAEPQMYIAIDESSVTERLLSVLGIHSSRLIPIKLQKSTWIHGAIVLQPPPLFLCRGAWNCVSDATQITANVLRDASMTNDAYANVLRERPKLLLLERARSRKRDGSCREQRCAKNLSELRDALIKEYGKLFDFTVVPPEMTVVDTIKTFAAADVIVGLHGAGFQNMMYCSKDTTVIHIGWGRHYEDLAKEFGLNYHLSKMKSLTRDSRNVVIDVAKIMADVRTAVNKDRAVFKHNMRKVAL